MLPSDHPRVGYITKMYPRFSETFIVNEILALESLGVEVEIFSLRPPADGRFHSMLSQVQAPVTYLSTHVRAPGLWQRLAAAHSQLPHLQEHLQDLLDLEADDAVSALDLALAIHERGIDRLHAHFGSVATAVARVAALLTGTDYSFTAHAKDIFHDSVDPETMRHRLADATSVVTVSDYNVDYLQRVYGSAADRVCRIYNGLDLHRFDYRAPEERPRVVLGVGRLVEKKGFDDLIAATDHLVRTGRPVHLDLIGTGNTEDDLRRQVRQRGLEDYVRFLGPLPQHEVSRRIQQAAALAAPCVIGKDGNRDGLPTILLEAMALGTPCVATPVTGIPEAIRHQETGLLVGERDPEGLAEALEALMTDADLRTRLAAGARALIEQEFDARSTSRQLRDRLTTTAPMAGVS